jgi:hypothetical protein
MSIQLQIEEMPDYLAVRLTGKGAAEEIWRQYELIAERCQIANKNKLLLDITEAHIEMYLADRYFLATGARRFARYKIVRAAFVGRPEQYDYKKFGEMVARNRWITARVFTTVRDAEAWLLKE